MGLATLCVTSQTLLCSVNCLILSIAPMNSSSLSFFLIYFSTIFRTSKVGSNSVTSLLKQCLGIMVPHCCASLIYMRLQMSDGKFKNLWISLMQLEVTTNTFFKTT